MVSAAEDGALQDGGLNPPAVDEGPTAEGNQIAVKEDESMQVDSEQKSAPDISENKSPDHDRDEGKEKVSEQDGSPGPSESSEAGSEVDYTEDEPVSYFDSGNAFRGPPPEGTPNYVIVPIFSKAIKQKATEHMNTKPREACPRITCVSLWNLQLLLHRLFQLLDQVT